VLSKAHPSALLEIVDREAPFLGSSTAQSSADLSVREVSTAVVNYWHAETIDDFLRIRMDELRRSPMWHWPPPEPAAAEATDAGGNQLGVFISHASEDKTGVALPIAEGLQAAGWKVWLDQYELTVGDSLFQRINDGLTRSRCGVVVLSESFFAKHWPKQELDALAAKESASGAKVILPVWHGIDEQYLAREAPMLASRLGVSTREGIPCVVEQLERALTKELGSDTTPGNSEPVFRSARDSDGNAGTA
jgi:TIR domain